MSGDYQKLRYAPIGLRAANEYIDEVHRHHGPVTGHKFSTSVVDDSGEIRGVAVAGRPVSRHLQAQGFIEVVRLATDGTRNACSMLYAGIARAAEPLGYPRNRVITYTLESESGASLRAAGWILDAVTSGGSWDRTDRRRTDKHPTEPKVRWVAGS